MSSADNRRFSDRFQKRDPFTPRIKPARDQSLLPIFDAAPPHTVHLPPKQPGPPSPEIRPPPLPPALSSGEKSKARDILAAIRTLQTVEREQRPATPEERQSLQRFGGFGAVALSIFPDPITGKCKDGWQPIVDELKSLLSAEEYDSARRTTFTAFYTSPTVITAMHEALERLGVTDDATILEPGAGTGNFLAHAKPDQRFIGVELDSLSGRIARVLHSQADIRIENFRDSKLPALDAVIGNVPFADIKLDHKGQRLSLHDFFVAKSVDALKPGGVLAVVTSHFTLDKQNAAVREQLAGQADFLGAIRLPSDAFKREATAVVTDIVFLRKRAPGQEPKHADADWLATGPLTVDGAEVAVNRYFLNHPEMVLGTWSRKDTLNAEGFSVISNGELAVQLREAVNRLPEGCALKPQKIPETDGHSHIEGAPKSDIHIPVSPSKPAFVPPPPLKHITEGSFFVDDFKNIRQIEDGKAQPVNYCGSLQKANGTPMGRRLGSQIELRDLSRRVLQSQNEGWPAENREDARRQLNRAYDRFVHAHGPINKTTFSDTKAGGTIRRMPNLVKFREDPDAMLVMSLEEYDEATGKAEKAAIMCKDVVGPKPPISSVSTAEEGLLVSLDQRGTVDIPYIARLYDKPEPAVIAELGELIYRDPETRGWQTADAYLSGNVRAKLVAAERAGPEYVRNAVALRSVQPEDVLPGDIDANLGAPWIPASDIRAFAAELFNVPADAFKIGHLKKDAVWSVEPDYRAINSVAATADYGTGRINGTDLLLKALNLQSPVIYDIIHHGDREERVVNQEETLAAREKQRAIKEKFKSWIFSDPDRTERLVRDYNDTYNNLRPRLFDGSHLDFPGMSKAIELRQTQKDAIWRNMSAGNTLDAHAVGGGKTWIFAASAMKMKQAGLRKKCLVTVPNHMLEQFGREWMQLYPNAKLLLAGKDDFTRERRKILTAKIATGDWDGIITTHSGFERIAMSDEFQKGFLREQIAEYESLLIDKDSTGRNIIKTIEKQKANREEKLKDLLAEDKKDSGLVFDELGVDQIFVDECFVHDTLVETDRGMLKIGDIVNNKLNLRLKTLNLTTNTIEWKPVVNWFPNKRRGQLIEVIHEFGSFTCTPNHKLWIDGQGYKKAVEASVGEKLLALRACVRSKAGKPQLEWTERKVLQSEMQDRRTSNNERLRDVQKVFFLSDDQSGKRNQEAEAILQRELQNEGSTSESRNRCDMAKSHAKVVGQPCKQRQKIPRDVGADEGTANVGRNQGEGISRPESYRSQTSSARGQRPVDCPTSIIGGEDGDDNRTRHPHEANHASHGKSGKALQSGFGRPISNVGSGIGRLQPQFTEGARTGCEEGQSLIASRVVSVTVLEPGSDGEYRFGGRTHSIVYDIEVADNHNYFANGVLVSNCHAFKNLETPTKMERVAGIQTGGSERAFDLLMKAKYLDSQHPGHGLIGASGTPISNSMVEMYTMQRFFDPAGLRSRGIEHFDGWAATFGEVVDTMEISPDGATLKPRSRFAKFTNLPELTQMFRAFADVQTAEMLDLPRPALEGGKPQTVACAMSEEQADIQAGLVKRYERIRSEKVDPREDNALNITTDGRKLALDGRMLGGMEDFPGSKVNALVANVARIWERTADKRGTQMIFCDMGVHPNPFSAYDEVVSKLTAAGIPRNQVAIMGDADTDAKKQALFEKVRQGTVRVLIGSTAKMGTGTNVQKRLVALHHLDAPWKPAEVEQREGRILRQGNTNEEVAIYRYVTEGSFDAYMWQALETKARFIAQIMSGDCAVRKAEDIGGQELSYAEVKAIASGNPAVLTLAEADAELQRLAILDKNHRDEQYIARRNLRDLPGEIKRLSERLDGLSADMATVAANYAVPTMESVAERMKRMPDKVSETYRTRLGSYRGLECGLILHPLGGTEVYLDGRARSRETLLRDNPGPKAILNALERLADGFDHDCRRLKAEIGVKEGQFQDYEARLGRPFQHAEYASQLADLRDKLKLGLSEKAPEGGETTAELAERIKALRAGNAVEATVERTGRRAVAAERPVTARIRARRVEAVVEALVEPEVAPVSALIKPAGEYRNQVILERQSRSTQLMMFT